MAPGVTLNTLYYRIEMKNIINGIESKIGVFKDTETKSDTERGGKFNKIDIHGVEAQKKRKTAATEALHSPRSNKAGNQKIDCK